MGANLSLARFERLPEPVTPKDVIFQAFRGKGKIVTVGEWSYAQANSKDVVRGLVLRWIEKLERALVGLRELVEAPSFHMPGRGAARVQLEKPLMFVSPPTVFKFGRSQ